MKSYRANLGRRISIHGCNFLEQFIMEISDTLDYAPAAYQAYVVSSLCQSTPPVACLQAPTSSATIVDPCWYQERARRFRDLACSSLNAKMAGYLNYLADEFDQVGLSDTGGDGTSEDLPWPIEPSHL